MPKLVTLTQFDIRRTEFEDIAVAPETVAKVKNYGAMVLPGTGKSYPTVAVAFTTDDNYIIVVGTVAEITEKLNAAL